jgi:hypothetical protein
MVKVLIAGSMPTANASQSAELFDPSTAMFTAPGDMTESGAETATLLPNGKVLITRSSQFLDEDHADIYDPATGTFTRMGDLVDSSSTWTAAPGEAPSATLLNDGRVLIAGGGSSEFGGSTVTKLYDPTTGAFSTTGAMTAGINAWLVAKLLPEGTVLIAGRCGGVEFASCIGLTVGPGIAEFYDPIAGTFSVPFASQSMEGHAATLLPDGTVLLSGGWICCGMTIGTAQIYHPGRLLPSPGPARLAKGLDLLPDSGFVVCDFSLAFLERPQQFTQHQPVMV